jgi:predicted transcriptional regulator
MRSFSTVFLILFLIQYVSAQIGTQIQQVTLTDVKNASISIPDLGSKVLLLFYLDPDVQDISDPLAESINAKQYPENKFGAIGIANCKDTWIPDALILSIAHNKQERFPKSLILLDKNHTLNTSWSLGPCNNQIVVLIVGIDMKVKYIKKISSKNQCIAIINTVTSLIEHEIENCNIKSDKK